MLTCAPHVPARLFNVRPGVHPSSDIPLNHLQSMGLNFLRNIRCMMFKSLTHFDELLGFGGNVHCLPIRVGRSRSLVGVKRAMVLGKLYSPPGSLPKVVKRILIIS